MSDIQPEIMINISADTSGYTPYLAELKALSLTELIDRYAKTWHRAANQPSNAELAEQCSMIKQLIGRQLEGWVPLDEIEDWCDR